MPHKIDLPHNIDMLHPIFMDLTGVDGKMERFWKVRRETWVITRHSNKKGKTRYAFEG
jgi:hypothetical protein